MKRYGVHVNGYTVGSDGEVSMWLARRSATKQTYPGMLDNMVRAVERLEIEPDDVVSNTVSLQGHVWCFKCHMKGSCCVCGCEWKAAGGLAADVGVKHTLVKECQEEACVPAAIAERARPVSTVR